MLPSSSCWVCWLGKHTAASSSSVFSTGRKHTGGAGRIRPTSRTGPQPGADLDKSIQNADPWPQGGTSSVAWFMLWSSLWNHAGARLQWGPSLISSFSSPDRFPSPPFSWEHSLQYHCTWIPVSASAAALEEPNIRHPSLSLRHFPSFFVLPTSSKTKPWQYSVVLSITRKERSSFRWALGSLSTLC